MTAGLDWLQRPPPALPESAAERAVRELWGLEVRAAPLYAERDLNFRLQTAAGHHWLLKISHPDIADETLALQHRVLRHLAERHPDLPVPRLLPDRSGRTIARWRDDQGHPQRLQIQSWLTGEHRKLARLDAPAREGLGELLARLDGALETLPAAAAPRDLAWDLQNFAALAPLRPGLEEGPLARAVDERLQRYGAAWGPALRALPRQLIHGDINSGNVLFEGEEARVSGLIDFGDMVAAPRVCELAVACAYHLSAKGEDPLAELAPLVAGYHRRRPLRGKELRLLPALVECRLVTTLLIQGWRARHEPDPDGDHAATADEAAARLRRMAATGRDTLAQGLRAACAATAPIQNP
ncbi:MAG: phosphotransferase [Gammaproteobacteria bacterium]